MNICGAPSLAVLCKVLLLQVRGWVYNSLPLPSFFEMALSPGHEISTTMQPL